MIPLIGTAIVNGFNWLERLIDSVDFPVDTFVIFNNNGKGELNKELDNLSKIEHPYINNIVVCHLPSNIGVSGAWNLIIKSYMKLPYWIIASHDIAFTEGLLEELFNKSKDESVGMIHGSGGDFGDGTYDLFLIRDWVVQKIGLFDENCYPAYCEDVDYIMRVTRWNWDNPNDRINAIPTLDSPYYHGLSLTTDKDYYLEGAQTKKSDPILNDKLDHVNLINFEYMFEKWGEHWRGTNPQKYPMGINGLPLTYTSYNLEFVRKKYLGF